MNLLRMSRLMTRETKARVLDLDLLSSSLPSVFGFSRPSIGTDVIDGVLTQFASNAPRISVQNGLLIEEARTNSIRNSQAGGAVAGVVGSGGSLPTSWALVGSGGISTEVVGLGVVNGFSYVDLRFSGTPSSTSHQVSFDGTTQIAVASGEKWTSSAWVALVGGSLTNISSVDVRSCEMASGTFVTADQAQYSGLNSTLQRRSVTRTMASGATHVQPRVRLNLTSGQAIDVTLRIAAPQCELGTGASSFIPTTSAAVARSQDRVDLASVDFIDIFKGTWFAEATAAPFGYDTTFSVNTRLLDIGPEDSQNNISLMRVLTTNRVSATVTTNGVQQASVSPASPSWSSGTTAKMALRYSPDDVSVIYTGASLASDTSIPNGIPRFSSIRVGRRSNGSTNNGTLNGYLRKLAYYPRVFSDAEMAAAVA